MYLWSTFQNKVVPLGTVTMLKFQFKWRINYLSILILSYYLTMIYITFKTNNLFKYSCSIWYNSGWHIYCELNIEVKWLKSNLRREE
jgi:hypothetical protein